MRRYPPGTRSHAPEIVAHLASMGVTIDLVDPHDQLIDLTALHVEHDLYVLKLKTDLTLSLAGALHAAGAAIVNPFPVSVVLRDKIITTRVLSAAGVPVPPTFAVSDPRCLEPLLQEGPLMVKPCHGSRGEGIRIVRDVAGLRTLEQYREPVIAQRYLPPDGLDRKLYVIGQDVFGVERTWPARTYEEKVGHPFDVPRDLAEIARACGRPFGIDLYGVDILVSDGRPYVVDASSFPGFKGVPDAARRVAEYLYQAVERAFTGRPPLPAPEELVTAAPPGLAAAALTGPAESTRSGGRGPRTHKRRTPS